LSAFVCQMFVLGCGRVGSDGRVFYPFLFWLKHQIILKNRTNTHFDRLASLLFA
jgi:hypothetical protein